MSEARTYQEIFEDCYSNAVDSCHDRPTALPDRDQIEAVLWAAEDNWREYADTDAVALVKLKDGRYCLISEWGDSSGHG